MGADFIVLLNETNGFSFELNVVSNFQYALFSLVIRGIKLNKADSL